MNFPTSQTPPPQSPYPASVLPSPAEPTGPGLSEAERLVNVFIAPKKTFEDLKRNASWWVPWLISAAFTLVFAVVAVQKIDMMHLVQQQIDRSPAAQKRMERATPEQRTQGMALQATITKVTFYISPLFTLLGGVIVAAILLFVFSFMLGAEVPFSRALAIVFYAGLPGIIVTILLTISVLASSDPSTIDIAGNPMPTNPGFFLDSQGNKFVYGIASAVDIFKVWWIVLLGLGFSTASSNQKPSAGNAVATMFVAYGILVLIGIGFKMAFS